MSFLYPNILWGLLAIFIPLLIHLFHSRNTVTINFSSIEYLNQLKNESIKKLNNLNWLLIILRMIIIGSLILMFSGPIVKNKGLWIPSRSESIAVVIIDNSASMSLEIDGKSLLKQSLDKIPTIISTYSNLVDLRIYQTSPPRLVYSRLAKNFKDINLSNLDINQSVSEDSIWHYTESILNSINAGSSNKECFILSDFSSYPDTSFGENNKDWQFYFLDQKELKDNISIKSVSIKNQVKLPNQNLDFLIKIENMGNKKIKNIPIEISLDNIRMGQIFSTFEKRETKDFLFRLMPPRSGIIKGEVNISSDSYSLDDSQSFDIDIPTKINCKIISNSKKSSIIYKNIFDSINGLSSFINYDILVSASFNRLDLDNIDVLIIDDIKNFSPRSIETIKGYLRSGGSAIWFSGKNYKDLNELTVKSLNLPLLKEQNYLNNNSFLNVEISLRDDAIFQELNLRDLDTFFPKIFKYNDVNRKTSDKMILELSNNSPFLLKLERFFGEIYFFSSPIDPTWNDFSLKGILIPMIHRIIAISATDESNISPIIINRTKLIKINIEDLNKDWILETPSKDRILLVPDYKKEAIIINQTNELGSYTIYSDGESYTSFSTKLSLYEFPNIRANKEQINEILSSLRVLWILSNSNIEELISSNRHGRSLWKFFLIIAIILFLVESFISRPRKKSI